MGTMNPTEATAQESADSRYIEEIVTLGTRTAGRTVTDSPVPVGVFAQDELESVGTASDLTNVIGKLVPSFMREFPSPVTHRRQPCCLFLPCKSPPNLLPCNLQHVVSQGKRISKPHW